MVVSFFWMLSNDFLYILMVQISIAEWEMGTGDAMEGHKPNNNSNMEGGCAYAGLGCWSLSQRQYYHHLVTTRNLLIDRWQHCYCHCA